MVKDAGPRIKEEMASFEAALLIPALPADTSSEDACGYCSW